MTPMDRLLAEHAARATALASLESEAARFADEGSADLDRIEDAVAVIARTPDGLRDAERTILHAPSIAGDGPRERRMRAALDELATIGAQLIDEVQDMREDVMVAKSAFDERLRAFIEDERALLDFEVQTLYPLARERLSQADWSALGEALAEAQNSPDRGALPGKH